MNILDTCFLCGKKVPKTDTSSHMDKPRWIDKCDECIQTRGITQKP
jgi:hypothetical protein